MVNIAFYLGAAVVLALWGSLAVLTTIFDYAMSGWQWVRMSIIHPDTSTKIRKAGWWS